MNDLIQSAIDMESSITQVVVSIHEKRNNPYEYGHYDCEVRFTADIQFGQNPDDTIIALRTKAHYHVQEQCNRWINELEAERRAISERWNSATAHQGESEDGPF